MIKRVKGAQDFLDLTLHNFIINEIKKHFSLYNFTEIQTPIIEHLELFNRSLGLYTEVVSKEMFVVEMHGSEKETDERICLRPEGTAGTVRAFIENDVQKTPWKVFSFGPMFRYERPQKGRYRQFHQINMEIIGSSSVFQDIQLIIMLDRFFHEKLMLNNYALQINYLGCFEDRKLYVELLDDFMQGPKAQGVCAQCQVRKERNIMRIFDCKNPQCQTIYREAPYIADNLCNPCALDWETLQSQLELLSISHIYRPTLVRGLDYYNATVFEFVSQNLGSQDAFCGGGRYNQLVEQLGAKQDHPAVGAAIGFERLLLLLESTQDRLQIPQPPALHIIIPLSQEQFSLALLLADILIASLLNIDILFEGSLKSMMRKANKAGAMYVLMLGESEQQTKTVMVKNMITGKEEHIAQTDVVGYLKKI